MNDAELTKLLRYISGESSPDETSDFRARLEHDAELRAEVEAWRRVREARLSAWNTEEALTTLQRDLHFGERRPPVRLLPFPERAVAAKRRVATALRVAAVLLAVAGAAAVWRIDRVPQLLRGVVGPLAVREYRALRGHRTTVRLPDGTQVMLAAETRLRVPRDFGRRGVPREVQLDGQAYFQVTHDETRPFLVRTARSVTEDLGTAFAIRAYPMEPEVEVAVVEGLVAVRLAPAAIAEPLRSSERQVLAPDQIARLDATGELRTERNVDLTPYLAWTKGNLAFDGPFRRAAVEVARWYDLDVRIADSALGARRIRGTVSGESVDAVLGYLALALGARYERQGRTVTFFPRQSTP